MAQSLKVVLLKSPDCKDDSLRSAMGEIEGIRLVSEISVADDLAGTLHQTRPDVLFVASGETPPQILLSQIGELTQHRKDLSVILAGPTRDPDLLLTAMRAGFREFVELPIAAEGLLEVLQKIIEAKPVRQMGKCIVVHGSGGGCGTSTLACNLGVELARAGRGRVVLVDLDVYMGQLAAMLDLAPTYNLLDLCSLPTEELDAAQLERVLLKHASGLRLVARPGEVASRDHQTLHQSVSVLNHLLESFDYVIVDMDIRQDTTDGKILTLADEIVVVTQPVINSVRNASHMLKHLANLDVGMDRIKLVLNRVPKKLGLLRRENIEKNLGAKVFWEVPEDFEAVSGSINMGVPLCDHSASSKASSSIRELAAELLASSKSVAAKSDQKDGFFKRLFLGGAPVTS